MGGGAEFPCGAFPDQVHATAAPGAGRGRGVQREMTGLVAAEAPPVFPLAFGLLYVGRCCAWPWAANDGERKPGGPVFPVFFNTYMSRVVPSEVQRKHTV